MSSVEFGNGNRHELARLGPTIDAVVRPHRSRQADPRRYPALIDTGASETCIDAGLAISLGLPAVDRQLISTPLGQDYILRYLARVELPDFNVGKVESIPGVHLSEGGQYHRLLIGRDLLQDMVLTYDGTAGSGSLTLSP